MEDGDSILSAADAIMEVGILGHLREFIKKGGQPQDAIRQLTEGYKGYADMCNLVASWLASLDDDTTSVTATVTRHVQSLLEKQFDPAKADQLMQGSPPQWLENLIQDEAWQGVIKKLSKNHPNCFMLRYAASKIVRLAGNATGDVADCVDFETFSDAFVQKISSLLRETDKWSVQYLEGLFMLCSASEARLLFCSCVLFNLAQHTSCRLKRALLLYLFHELFVYAGKNHYPSVARANATKVLVQGSHVSTPSRDPSRDTAPAVCAMLHAMVKHDSLSQGDVDRLYNLMQSPNASKVSSCLSTIPKMPELLIHALFHPINHVNLPHKKKYIYVLACLCTPSKHLENTVTALTDAQRICSSKTYGSDPRQTHIDLRSNLSIPVVSASVLYWISQVFSDPDYFSSTYHSQLTPVSIALLGEVCSIQPLQRRRVFEVSLIVLNRYDGIPLDPIAAVDYCRQALRLLIHLLHCGIVKPVFDLIKEKAGKGFDHSLLRAFVVTVIASIEAPYSRAFVADIVQILALPPIALALSNAEAVSLLEDNTSTLDCERVVQSFIHYLLQHQEECLDPNPKTRARQKRILQKYIEKKQ